jgi:hypothetical protein
MITHTINGVVRPRVAVARYVSTDTRLDEAIALRQCALYRKAFRGTAVAFPAEALRLDAVATWIRNHGVTVDVASTDDLDRVRLAEIGLSHVVMHCQGDVSASVRLTALSRFVVHSVEHVAELADNPLAKRLRVVVDTALSDEVAVEVMAHRRLELLGLHHRVGACAVDELADNVVAMIARMARISHKRAIVLTRVSLGDVDVTGRGGDLRSLQRLVKVIDQAVEDGCIRFRYPRPALTVSPRRTLLLP